MSKVLEQKKMAQKEAPEKNPTMNTGKDKTVKNEKGTRTKEDKNADKEKNEKEYKRGRQ